MNQFDRVPSLRRNYYRRVRSALFIAAAIHVAAFILAPPYRPAPRIMRPDPLRLLSAGGLWARPVSAAAGGAPSSAPGWRPRSSPLAGVVAAEAQEIKPEQWAPPSQGGNPATASGTVTGGGTAGERGTMEEEAAPVYYGYDTPPRALRTFEPTYPLAAKYSGFEGTVVININLDEHGRILRAWVASSSAPEILVSTALDAVYQFQFSPGSARGVPVRSTVAVPFRFFLKRIS